MFWSAIRQEQNLRDSSYSPFVRISGMIVKPPFVRADMSLGGWVMNGDWQKTDRGEMGWCLRGDRYRDRHRRHALSAKAGGLRASARTNVSFSCPPDTIGHVPDTVPDTEIAVFGQIMGGECPRTLPGHGIKPLYVMWLQSYLAIWGTPPPVSGHAGHAGHDRIWPASQVLPRLPSWLAS